MSKKWVPAAALLIICCCAAYQLLREAPAKPGEAGDTPRIENTAPAGGKRRAGDAGSATSQEAAPEPAAPGLENTISGRVIAADNRDPAEARAVLPVSGAVISLLNNPRATATTDDNGSFGLSPVAARANDLLIRAAGYGVATRLRVPPGVEGLVIRLDKALTLRGKTSFADGRPAPGIEVLLHSAATLEADPFSRTAALHGRPAEARGVSGAEGAFAIGGLSERDWFVRVKGTGIVEQVLDGPVWVRPGMLPIEIVVDAGQSTSGKVIDEAGNPLPEIEVWVYAQFDEGIFGILKRRTDDQGGFLFDGLSDRSFELLVGASSDFVPLQINQSEPGKEMLVELARGASLSGKVIDEATSLPVVGAVIGWSDGTVGDKWFIKEIKSPEDKTLRESITDSQGLFRLRGVPWEEVELKVHAEGYSTLELDNDILRKAPPRGGHVLGMKRAGTVPGIVQDENGNPVAGAQVHLKINPQSAFRLSNDESDDQGRFRLRLDSTPKNQAYTIGAEHEDYLSSDPVEIHIEDSTREQPGTTLTLLAGASISGKIKLDREQLPSGRSLAGLRLMLLRVEDGQLVELNRSTLSDANGVYRLPGLAEGEYVLRSDSAGFSPYQGEPLRLKSKARLIHDIILTAERVIKGRVTDLAGKPLRAAIHARDLRHGFRFRSRRTTFSDRKGFFRLGSLGPGPYRISASASGHLGATENSFAPPGELEFVLEPTGSIEGRVLDGATGKPVDACSIRLLQTGEASSRGSRTYSFEEPSGFFLAESISVGKYELTITANGYLPLKKKASVTAGGITDAGVLELSAGRLALVSIRDERSDPIGNCSLEISRKVTGRQEESAPAQGSFLTNEKGKALISGLSTGVWTVKVGHPRFLSPEPLRLELAADDGSPPPTLEITLLSGCSLRGRFNNPVVEGRPEHLRLVGKGILRNAWPDKDRNYLFEGLPPGSYTLLHFANAELIGTPMEIRIESGAQEVVRDINGD